MGEFVSPESHFELLHREAHGTVVVWEKLLGKNVWTKLHPGDAGVPEFLGGLSGRKDVFLTVNEFDGWNLTRLLRSLRALYVDLDREVWLEFVFEALCEAGLPEPSVVVESGRGMHLYWLMEPTPPRALPIWQEMQDKLFEALRPLGADPRAKDCTRLLRMVGTENGKWGKEVKGTSCRGFHWPFSSLRFEILGERKPRKKPERGGGSKERRVPRKSSAACGSIYAWWHVVFEDLFRMAEYWGTIPEGHRDEWLFLVGVALSWFSSAEALRNELVSAAKTFTPGLRTPEITKVAKLIQRRAEAVGRGETVEWMGEQVDPRYRFRRSVLYSRLRDLIPDDLLGRMRAIIPDALAKERKSERDEARYEDHYTGEGVRVSNEDKRASAHLMGAQGRSIREIAGELGVGKSTVFDWLKGENGK